MSVYFNSLYPDSPNGKNRLDNDYKDKHIFQIYDENIIKEFCSGSRYTFFLLFEIYNDEQKRELEGYLSFHYQYETCMILIYDKDKYCIREETEDGKHYVCCYNNKDLLTTDDVVKYLFDRFKTVTCKKDMSDVPFATAPVYEIMCKSCIGMCKEKLCGFAKGKMYNSKTKQMEPANLRGNATSCSYYWPMPKNLKDWIYYYYIHKIRNHYYWYKSLFYEKLRWFNFKRQSKKIPCLLGEGSIVEWKTAKQYDDNYNVIYEKEYTGLNGEKEIFKYDYETIHKTKINKIWVEYSYGKFYIMVSASEEHEGKYQGYCIETLENHFKNKEIVSVDGKNSYVEYHGF